MAQEKVFAKGFFAEKKTFSWGSFPSLSIKVDEAIAFLQQYKNEKGYVNLDIKESQKGDKMYVELNTFKPKPASQNNNTSDDSGLPF